MGVLAGCTNVSSGTGRTVRYDGGALVVQPASRQPVVYDRAAAVYDLTHSVPLAADWKLGAVEVGYVTINLWVRDDHNVRVPAPTHRLAWVLHYQQGNFPHSSPPHLPGSSPGGCNGTGKDLSRAGEQMLIVDALDETTYGYSGTAKGICGGTIAPGARLADQNLSVPWTDAGGDRVRATIPGCFSYYAAPSNGSASSAANRWSTQVLAYGPIGPCDKPPTTQVISLGLSRDLQRQYPQPWLHGALGPVPLGGFGF